MHRTLVGFLLLSLGLSGCDNQKPVGNSEKEDRPPASSLLDLLKENENPADQTADALAPDFVDVAAALGVKFQFFSDTVAGRYYLPEVMGGGVVWLDFDCDGRLDLYLANGSYLDVKQSNDGEHFNRLYRNTTHGFDDLSLGCGAMDLEYGQGVTAGDFNADGFPDLFVANYGENHLYQNQGDGTFRDVTAAAGITGSVWSSSVLWLDLDRDGDLDLYVVNYLAVRPDNYRICRWQGVEGYCGPGEYMALDDDVYLNQGDGTFVESSEALGLVGANGKGLAITAMDFDLDGVPEIYVANDMTPNFLFSTRDPFGQSGDAAADTGQANPQPTSSDRKMYTELGVFSGTAASDVGQPEASMGIACGDYNGDGLPDIFLTHFYSQKNTLYRNRGGLVFTDESKTSNIARTSYDTLGFGTVSLDFDLDGAIDLFVANGHVLGPKHPPFQMQPQLLRNDGNGVFTDKTAEAGKYFAGKYLGRGAAGADFDNDGDADIAVTHIGAPFALLENRTVAEPNYLGLQLTSSERIHPVGTRVEVTYDGRTKVYVTSAGGSYLSEPDSRLLIGLGNHEGPVDVKILWSSGEVSQLRQLPTRRYWQIQAGGEPRDLSQLPE